MRSGMPDNLIGKIWLYICGCIILPIVYNPVLSAIILIQAIIIAVLIALYPHLDHEIVKELIEAGWR